MIEAEVDAKTREENSSSIEKDTAQIEIVGEIVEKDEKPRKTTTKRAIQAPTTTTRLLINDSISYLKDNSADSNRKEIEDKPPTDKANSRSKNAAFSGLKSTRIFPKKNHLS